MTDDNTILEMAAKAAGLDGYIREWCLGPEFIVPGEKPVVWDPLKDNLDAARLMIQFGFVISQGNDAERGEFCEVIYRPRKYARKKSFTEYYQDHPDKFAAGRRAVARAAAEIGKVMP